jgi:hypothetical protein
MFDLKGFIGAILHRNTDDPIANLRSATIWVQELPHKDVRRAQSEIVKTVAGMNQKVAKSLKERIKVLLYLDEKASSLQELLCSEYMSHIGQPEDTSEKSSLPTILGFWDEMATAYNLCVRAFAKDPSSKLWDQIPLITAKALHYHAMQAKWSHLRYLPVEPQVWRNLHRLYLFAEREDFDKTPLHLFPGQDETSCVAEYVQPLLLQLAGTENLLPSQIEMIDKWLDSWASSVTVEATFRPHRQLFAVNTGEGRPAMKLRRNMVGEKYHYLSTALLLITIQKVVEQLMSGEIPARLKLSENCRLPTCLDLIELVRKRWACLGTTRQHERQASEKSAQVVQGFAAILTQLKPGARARAAAGGGGEVVNVHVTQLAQEGADHGATVLTAAEPELFAPTLKHWVIENESQSGFGVAFDADQGTSLKIGMLVGLKPFSKKHFCIGIVRRINNDPSGKVYVGLQTLSQTPILVKLGAAPSDASGGTRVTEAVYLPEAPQIQLARGLLVSRDFFAPAKAAQLSAQGKSYSIRLRQALEQSDDFALVNFDVLSKQ